jgi:hypothetical protein
MGMRKIRPLTCNSVEPPIGIEPMTYALREARDLAAYARAAPIAPAIALMALAALGLSDDPVHEPVHARPLRHIILLLCVTSLRTLYPRTRAGPACHEPTVYRPLSDDGPLAHLHADRQQGHRRHETEGVAVPISSGLVPTAP